MKEVDRPNLRYCLLVIVEGIQKTIIPFDKTTCLRGKIWLGDPGSMKREF
jgi:hypothetical protein